MGDFSKISYYDLKLEALKGRLLEVVGRAEEITRIARILSKKIHNNCILVGPSGVGKTSLVRGFAQKAVKSALPIVEFSSDSFNPLNSAGPVPLQRFKEALESLPECAVVIDNFGQLVFSKSTLLNYLGQLMKPLAEGGKVRLVLTMDQKELKWIETEQPSLLNFFEVVQVKEQSLAELKEILLNYWENLKTPVPENSSSIADLILQLTIRFPSLGQNPAASIKILDEALALGRKYLTEKDIYQVVADKTGIPLSQLASTEKEMLKKLEEDLNEKIIGQEVSINKISSSIKRAKLGLKNPGRPLSSFLVLGPSGVGKTETAKLLAEKVFGKKDNFFRIDMSEFGEAHAVSRLIGAPAGYVGFNEGGGLTNAVKKEPYTLVLLDEIEKANPKIFDIFLQVLDDGRLTSGQGETVDFTQTIIMATSNVGVKEIIDGYLSGQDIHSEEFYQAYLAPALTKIFRLEFLNRFDAILVYKPLSKTDLLEIAKLEIKKVEERVAKHNIKFKIEPEVLTRQIEKFSDPRFGARPVKRFVESVCEELITQKLLS